MCINTYTSITKYGNKITYCNSYIPFTLIKCPRFGCIIGIEKADQKDYIMELNKHEGVLG